MNKKLFISLPVWMVVALFAALAVLIGAPARAEESMVDTVIKELNKESKVIEVPIGRWKMAVVKDESCLDPNFVPDKKWKAITSGSMFPMNDTGYWFWAKFKVPETVEGMPVKGSKIFLKAGMERSGDIYVNGQWKNSFTHFDGEALLTINAKPGEEYSLVIKGANSTGGVVFTKAVLQFSAFTASQQEVNQYINDILLVRNMMDFAPDKAKWTKMLDKSVSLVDLAARDGKDNKSSWHR